MLAVELGFATQPPPSREVHAITIAKAALSEFKALAIYLRSVLLHHILRSAWGAPFAPWPRSGRKWRRLIGA